MVSDFDEQRQIEEWLDAHPDVLCLIDDIMGDLHLALGELRYGLTEEGVRALKNLGIVA